MKQFRPQCENNKNTEKKSAIKLLDKKQSF